MSRKQKKVTKAESWRDTGVGLGETTMQFIAGWCLIAPIIVGVLGLGASRFAIGKESFDPVVGKMADATMNVYATMMKHAPKKSTLGTAVDKLNRMGKPLNIKWSAQADGTLLTTVKRDKNQAGTQDNTERVITSMLTTNGIDIPYHSQFDVTHDETSHTTSFIFTDPNLIASIALWEGKPGKS